MRIPAAEISASPMWSAKCVGHRRRGAAEPSEGRVERRAVADLAAHPGVGGERPAVDLDDRGPAARNRIERPDGHRGPREQPHPRQARLAALRRADEGEDRRRRAAPLRRPDALDRAQPGASGLRSVGGAEPEVVAAMGDVGVRGVVRVGGGDRVDLGPQRTRVGGLGAPGKKRRHRRTAG